MFEVLSEAERVASLRETMAAAPSPDDFWVFAFGSLMWRPDFTPCEKRPARLDGYVRRFSMWTVLSRGTVENPGLGLCLERGAGSCLGLAYRLEPGSEADVADALWQREMLTGIYRPAWLPVTTEDGDVTALTFLVDPAHPQYAGDFSADEQAALIAAAAGKHGTNRDYLASTVGELEKLGMTDAGLSDLLARVDALAD